MAKKKIRGAFGPAKKTVFAAFGSENGSLPQINSLKMGLCDPYLTPPRNSRWYICLRGAVGVGVLPPVLVIDGQNFEQCWGSIPIFFEKMAQKWPFSKKILKQPSIFNNFFFYCIFP